MECKECHVRIWVRETRQSADGPPFARLNRRPANLSDNEALVVDGGEEMRALAVSGGGQPDVGGSRDGGLALAGSHAHPDQLIKRGTVKHLPEAVRASLEGSATGER